MKIIKEGNLEKIKKIRRFDCSYCDCIFEADNTEYKIHYDQREGSWIEVYCPFCGSKLMPSYSY